MLILFFLTFAIERVLHWWEMLFLGLQLILDLMICMLATLEGLWVKLPPTMRGAGSLPVLVHAGCMSFCLSLAFLLSSGHRFLLGFFFVSLYKFMYIDV
jgi:hypothetical protein